jgi:hypothetical protein
LVIEFQEPPDAEGAHRVYVRFLVDGPEELLDLGSVFELMEGSRTVATGTVTG